MSTPVPANGHDPERCGASRRDGTGDTCGLPAGWGTGHVGHGPCRLHGGNTRSHITAAERAMREQQVAAAQQQFGLPVDVPPDQALAEQLGRLQGRVTYLQALVSGLGRDGLKQLDMKGQFERPAVWIEMLDTAERELRATAKTMIDAGFAEREVRLAERQSELMVAVLEEAVRAAGLDEAARVRVLSVAAERLELEGGGSDA